MITVWLLYRFRVPIILCKYFLISYLPKMFSNSNVPYVTQTLQVVYWRHILLSYSYKNIHFTGLVFYLFLVFYLGVLTQIYLLIKNTILLSSYISVRVLSGALVTTDEPDNQKRCSEPFLLLIVWVFEYEWQSNQILQSWTPGCGRLNFGSG